MAPELFLRRIKEEFPEITWNTYRHLTHGWDHAVLILDEALVFRAPTDPASPSELGNEAGLLRHLERRLDVGIPRYVHLAADGSFGGYRLLPGRELDIDTLSGTLRGGKGKGNRAARGVPDLAARDAEVRRPRARGARERPGGGPRRPRSRHREARVTASGPVGTRGRPGRCSPSWPAELKRHRPTALLHGDLSGEHILWDAEKRRINIIDFSDRMLGNPALDFAGPPRVRARLRSTRSRRVRRARGTSGRSRGHGCTSSGSRSRRWCIRSRAIRAPSSKATRSSGRDSGRHDVSP